MENSTFDEFLQNENLFVLRSMFYLLKPSETFIKNEHEVPDLTKKSVPIFFAIMFVEQIILLLKNGKFSGRIEDVNLLNFLLFVYQL